MLPLEYIDVFGALSMLVAALTTEALKVCAGRRCYAGGIIQWREAMTAEA